MPLDIAFWCTVYVHCHPGYQGSLLHMTCFSFPPPSAAAAAAYGGVVAEAPPLCHAFARRSPQRLADKCTSIHNTCGGGFIYRLANSPPRPRRNTNSVLHQFKCVMSPTWTCASTYHIYDMLRHIAGPGKISEPGNGRTAVESFIINEGSNFQHCFPIENYRSIRDVVEPED